MCGERRKDLGESHSRYGFHASVEPGTRRGQPDAWRQVRAWRPGNARPSTARRVAADTVRTQWRTGRRAQEPAASFTARRKAQLEGWRRTLVWRRGSS
ncbi:MAG: hypothetical protein IH806_07325 [Proteobacteria bacterium]|nr:hypothetical protein [Pseudomonadota bacterium]